MLIINACVYRFAGIPMRLIRESRSFGCGPSSVYHLPRRSGHSPVLPYRATRSRVYSCYACSTGHNLMFCHRSPTRACVTGNGGVRSLWDNVTSSSKMATEA